MRVLAMYLPQFHRIPENDAWWGEGFTEWTAVKNAKPLYEGHEQPRVPLNDNYYDLLDKNTMEWQASLMHEYGIDGMCMYHYWFKDGKRLLEKPAENLLKWTDIDMPFCFCWANETWARSWSDAEKWVKNAWADTFEPDRAVDTTTDKKGILVKQEYGDQEDWTEHFEYLLPFLRDERYIQIDDRPVIIIYRASEIDCIGEMICCWRQLALDNGLNGLFIMGGGIDRDISDYVDAIFYRTPADLYKLFRRYPGRDKNAIPFSYKEVWKAILDYVPLYNAQPYFVGITGYDTTPRQGKKATIYEGVSPDVFEENLYELLIKSDFYGSDMVFINAWNEWGEGMYLEPDTKWEYSFLESVLNVKKKFIKYECSKKDENKSKEIKILRDEIIEQYSLRKKSDGNVSVLERWLMLYEKGMDLAEYIFSHYKGNIAIYGYGVLGRRLKQQLENKKVKIACIIDRNIEQIKNIEQKTDCRYVKDIKNIPEVDFIIVAVSENGDRIKRELSRNLSDKSVYTLSEIIDSAFDSNSL